MEITTQPIGEALEVKVKGRLDNYWGEHLQRNLEELIRSGAHHLRLNFSEVSYLSSAGVGLLVRHYRQLSAIGGTFVIITPSDHVKMVIELCHLSAILLSAQASVSPPVARATPRQFSSASASFELLERTATKPLACKVVGNPSLLMGCRFGPHECASVRFPKAVFGLGLGAFGHGFEDSQHRFGEFLAVAGSAAYLPTDGTNVPDFMISRGDLVPELNVLYGLRLEGDFSHLLRFEPTSANNAITLMEVVQTALQNSGAASVGMVLLAESAGLIGAALRRSPASPNKSEGAPFQYPDVRSWLSFSAERLFSRSLVLAAGVASVQTSASLFTIVRPLGAPTEPHGHFHAAAFSYRPLPKSEIDLHSTVTGLFESEYLQAVLHLLPDDRQAGASQQSEFVRGACWFGAISGVQ
jgi:anti-sigma B factor antagonist